MKILPAVVVASVTLTFSTYSLACSQDEAIETMRAISQAQTERLRGSAAQQQIAARMAVQVAPVGKLLAEANYEGACQRYEEIAREFGVDLDDYRAQLAPLGGAASGGCDTAAATRKVNGAYAQFRDKVDTSGMTPREQQALHQRFSQSLDEATRHVQTEPARACDMVDRVLEDFGAK